jgi:hypothetical protein
MVRSKKFRKLTTKRTASVYVALLLVFSLTPASLGDATLAGCPSS